MKITLQSEPREKARFFVRISEFSYTEFPVPIKREFRCVLHPAGSTTKTHERLLLRIFQALVRTVRQNTRSIGFQIRTNSLQVVENGLLASAWTARAFAARMFIRLRHPGSSWITDRLPVALWPQALKREIQQAGFAKRANLEERHLPHGDVI
jgi:hypothetical protein